MCLTIFTSACTFYRINSEEMGDTYYLPKKASDEVTHVEKITQPHEVIGVITVTADRSAQRMATIIENMKREAAILGGDAITDVKMLESSGIWKKIRPQKLLGNAYLRVNFTAKVIVFK